MSLYLKHAFCRIYNLCQKEINDMFLLLLSVGVSYHLYSPLPTPPCVGTCATTYLETKDKILQCTHILCLKPIYRLVIKYSLCETIGNAKNLEYQNLNCHFLKHL